MPTPSSQIQQHFQLHSIYKRSRRYFDIQKLNSIEHRQELTRRKPSISGDSMVIGSRVDEEFICSQEKITQRVRKQIEMKKKNRQDEYGETDTSYSFTTSVKPVVPDLSKMLPRQSLSKKPSYYHQRQFHNFEPLPLPSNSIDFNKFISREKTENRKHSSAMEIDGEKIGKSKQFTKFDKGVYACYVRYRQIDDKKVKNPEEPKQISIEKIRYAESQAKPNHSPMQHSFYQSVPRDVMPMSLAVQKTMFPPQNFYSTKKNQPKQDFMIMKKKQDMILKRLQGIMARKHIKDIKGEGCDQKYFRRNQIEGFSPF